MNKNKNKKSLLKRISQDDGVEFLKTWKFEQKKPNKEMVKAANDRYGFVTDWQMRENE